MQSTAHFTLTLLLSRKKVGWMLSKQLLSTRKWKGREPVLHFIFRKQNWFVMKLTAILLLSACLQVSANGFSQNVTLSGKDISLQKIFKQIHKQTGYQFFYEDEMLSKAGKIDIQVKDAPLEKVLDICFQNLSLSYLIVNNTITVKPKKVEDVALLQQVPAYAEIHGTVKDAQGNPLAGVSVIVKRTQKGTSTDNQGRFSVEANEGDILEFTIVGYGKKSMKVTKNNDISMVMEIDVRVANEVVVVGYGSSRRGDLTTAQTTVTAKAIEKTVNTTVDQALQGRAAGVMVTTNSAQPGGSISVSIRGISTLSGSNEPLYVIDGIQIQPGLTGYNNQSSLSPLAQLNPSDIESMEVLEGPSATAIYGSKATNGVVLITTKRGKPGETKIQYELNYSLQDRPQQIPVLHLKDYTIMNNELRSYQNDSIPEIQKDPSILGSGTNWQNELFRRAPLVKHQLSFSGGGERTTYYLSAEKFNQEGVVKGSAFDRASVRLNLDTKAKKWLRLGLNLNASQTNDNVSTTVIEAIRYAFTLPPYIAAINPDGSYGGYPADEIQYHNEDLNPLARAELETHTSKRNNYNGGFNATISLLKGLEFRSGLNASYANSSNTDFIPTYTIGAISRSKAELSEGMTESSYWNWNQLLEYKTKLFNSHQITVMASHEAQEARWKGQRGTRLGFPVNEMPGGQVPSISLGDPIGQSVGGYKGWTAQESYLARLNYNYSDRYLLTFTYRGDGSINFGRDKRWGFFPSGSVAWRVSSEPFFENLTNIISDFKIRLETGLTGNQGNGIGVFAPLRPVASPWGNGFLVNKYGNPNLQWESTLTNNIGFNISLFHNRVSFEGDFYVRKTDNLLMDNPLPFYMGTSGAGAINPPTVNIGALSNRGWAFTLNTINIDTKAFTWSTNFNISHNRSRIDRLYQETAVIDMTNGHAGGGFIQRSAVGKEAWQFWGYKGDGLFKTMDELNGGPLPQKGTDTTTVDIGRNGVWIGDYRFVDLDGNGRISPQDMTYIGNPYPAFTFGLTNDVTYKNLSLSVLLIGSSGNKIYNAFRYGYLNPARVYEFGNVLQESYKGYARIGLDAYGEPTLLNTEATVPRYGGGNGNWSRASDRFVEDGSYIRVKNISLSYQLSEKIINKIKYIGGLRILFGVQNAFTFTRYSGFDPEVGIDVGHHSDVSRRTFGVDVGQYPQVRSFIFNVRATF